MAKQTVTRKVALVLTVMLLLQLIFVATVSAAPSCFYYTVQWGDSISRIAWTYGDNPWDLAARNGIANPNFIRAGQVLYVCNTWGGGYAPPAGYHTVHWGESLWSIANMYGTTPWAIASMNGIFNLNLIYAGQVLRVY